MPNRELVGNSQVFWCGAVVVEKALAVAFPAVEDKLRISKDSGIVQVLKAYHC